MQTYLINLQERTDRLEQFRYTHPDIEFTLVRGIKVKDKGRYKSIGSHGCALSHLLVWSMATDDTILVLEDDALLCDDWQSKLDVCMSELPDDWEFIFLGAYFYEYPKLVNKHLRVGRHTSTHAYVINMRYIKQIHEKYITTLMKRNQTAIDIIICNYNLFKHFVTAPMLAIQRGSHSDIVLGYRDYTKEMLKYETEVFACSRQ